VTAPYRADQVGSLLRPPEVLEARTAREAGKISAAQLRGIEDTAIVAALELQRQVGLNIYSDGEYRRAAGPAISPTQSKVTCPGRHP